MQNIRTRSRLGGTASQSGGAGRTYKGLRVKHTHSERHARNSEETRTHQELPEVPPFAHCSGRKDGLTFAEHTVRDYRRVVRHVSRSEEHLRCSVT
ncbi:hypothetical protein TNCT_512151 [Trichonephila clavata]|uniref:Uncharacterized protein n=1 Tax=Trichonephila clavata TaxID=2740835 RepID=A0A8X6KQN5_TRICU|nr:hypothetical protein TNCT_512151 [Trichonephila clavata]